MNEERAPIDWLTIGRGNRCGCGSDAVLINTNTSQRVRATVSIGSNPNSGNYPQQRIFFVEAGGETSMGCDCLGGGGTGPIQHFTFRVVGASVASAQDDA